MRKQLLFGIVLAAVCLYFAFRGLSVRETFHLISQARLRWILFAAAVYTVGYLLRTVRWRVILEPVERLNPAALYPIMMIGYLANNVLPFRVGELVRAHITGRKFAISRTASLGTILLERLFDTFGFLSTFMAAALFFTFPPLVKKAAGGLGSMCVAVVLALAALVYRGNWFEAALGKSRLPARWQEKMLALSRHFVQGISGIFQPKAAVASLVLSLAIWIVEGTVLYLIARAYAAPLGYPQAFFLLFFMGLAVTLPQAPGYVGTIELFGVTALLLLGMPKNLALPIVLTVHGFQFLYVLVVGLVCLWSEGLSLRMLARTASPAAS